MPKGKCEFQEAFMSRLEYFWVLPGKDKYHFKCDVCKSKDLGVSWGCESALKKHQHGQTHQDKVKALENSKKGLSSLFFRKLPASTTPSSASSSPALNLSASTSCATSSSSNLPTPVACGSTSNASNGTLMDKMVSSQALVTAAECRMILRLVKHHDSFRSCLDLGDDLKTMFPDSAIASKFTLSKTKCAYVIKFGIAPWLKQNLQKVINESPFYSVSYDESLNRQLQEQQMDLQVRYWCNKTNRAITRYYGSEFQMHGDHQTLKDNLLKGVADLSGEKLIQTAMDGPSVNWLVLRVLQEKREEDGQPPLQDIGSCGLHVVSGALHSAVAAADWPVEKVLRGQYKLLKDAPARRAEYMRLSTTGLYPEKFCTIRWVENEPVADRAIQIWSDVVALIKCFQEKVPSKRPKDNKSYDNLVKYHLNPLIPVYLHLFRDVAARLNVFLVKFQTDSPMVPFLSEEMAGILKWVMRFFIHKTVLKKTNTPYKLYKLDVQKKENTKLQIDIKLTTSGTEALKKVPIALHQGLKDSWVTFLKKLVEKIQERSPIGYKLVRVAAALNPNQMATQDSETLQNMFDAIVGIMYSNKRISSKVGDNAKEQFAQFLAKVLALNKNEFLNFDMKTTRLDEFLAFYVCSSSSYSDFWHVCKFVFTLCHGQSSVERGFNVNKQTMVENLEELGLTSLRMIYDEILQHGGKIKDFPIPNTLLFACQSAYSKYKNDLERKNAEAGKAETTNKRKLLMEELSIVKKQKTDEEVLVKQLRKDSDKFVLQAGETSDVVQMKELVVKANSFKKTADEKEKKLADYSSSIKNMEEEIKNLK